MLRKRVRVRSRSRSRSLFTSSSSSLSSSSSSNTNTIQTQTLASSAAEAAAAASIRHHHPTESHPHNDEEDDSEDDDDDAPQQPIRLQRGMIWFTIMVVVVWITVRMKVVIMTMALADLSSRVDSGSSSLYSSSPTNPDRRNQTRRKRKSCRRERVGEIESVQGEGGGGGNLSLECKIIFPRYEDDNDDEEEEEEVEGFVFDWNLRPIAEDHRSSNSSTNNNNHPDYGGLHVFPRYYKQRLYPPPQSQQSHPSPHPRTLDNSNDWTNYFRLRRRRYYYDDFDDSLAGGGDYDHDYYDDDWMENNDSGFDVDDTYDDDEDKDDSDSNKLANKHDEEDPYSYYDHWEELGVATVSATPNSSFNNYNRNVDSTTTNACHRLKWADTQHPTCTLFHETQQLYRGRYLAHGYHRDSWLLETMMPMVNSNNNNNNNGGKDHDQNKEEEKHNNMVLKALRLNNADLDFDAWTLQHNSVEALLLERTSASDRTMNIYGHCGASLLVEQGWEISQRIAPGIEYEGRGRIAQADLDALQANATRQWQQKLLFHHRTTTTTAYAPLVSLNHLSAHEKLDTALAMAEALALLHGHEEGVVVLDDMHPDQFLVNVHGHVKLNDLNHAHALEWDADRGTYCTFRMNIGGDYRSSYG